jgi:DNA-binding CsgD family transcriptional regulator
MLTFEPRLQHDALAGHAPDSGPSGTAASSYDDRQALRAGSRRRSDFRSGLGHAVHFRCEPHVRLTAREREVLTWVGRGKTSAEIAIILGVSERTVNFHCDRAVRRLDAINRTHAVAKAIAGGLTRL